MLRAADREARGSAAYPQARRALSYSGGVTLKLGAKGSPEGVGKQLEDDDEDQVEHRLRPRRVDEVIQRVQ